LSPARWGDKRGTSPRATSPFQGAGSSAIACGAPVTTLDAFQRGLLGSEYGNMLSCVRCGQCLTSCPTYVLSGREAEGPRGRVALARALHDGVLPLTEELLAHERNCLVCDAC